MVKSVIFILLLALVLVYPVIESSNVSNAKQYNIKLPNIVFINGKFSQYKPFLVKEGNFSTFLIEDKRYIAKNLFLNNLEKNETVFFSKANYKQPVLKGKDVIYESREYNLSALSAVYNTKTAVLTGNDFNFTSKTLRGIGKKFTVDKDKNIKAKNPTFYLKVENETY